MESEGVIGIFILGNLQHHKKSIWDRLGRLTLLFTHAHSNHFESLRALYASPNSLFLVSQTRAKKETCWGFGNEAHHKRTQPLWFIMAQRLFLQVYTVGKIPYVRLPRYCLSEAWSGYCHVLLLLLRYLFFFLFVHLV